MAAPKTAIPRFDLSFSYSEFASEAQRRKYIGMQVFPVAPVNKDSATYSQVKAESFTQKVEDTQRAPKGTYRRDDFQWETNSYQTEDHGVEEVLDDRRLAQFRDEINAELIHSERALNRLLRPLEAAIAAAAQDDSTLPSAAATVAWTTKATADPIADIDLAIETVSNNVGSRPNTIIFPQWALTAFKRTDRVEGLLKYSGRDDPKNLGVRAVIMDLFEIENVLIADGYASTAGRDLPASLNRIWDATKCTVLHVGTSNDMEAAELTVGRTFMWTEENATLPGSGEEADGGVIIEEYREENRRGGILRARHDRQVKTFHANAGYVITGVTA